MNDDVGLADVETEFATLRCERWISPIGDGVIARGVRYCHPFSAESRFSPARPLGHDSFGLSRALTQVDALEFGSICPQRASMLQIASEPEDEDCGFLNIWAPDRGTADLPVMVWFHGGGFSAGSGSMSWYDGARLAARGAVVVTVNYRLGPLGFLDLGTRFGEEAAGSGVAGLTDQAAALGWVRSNIAAFGGNPDRVTIFGESAGAMSCATHLAMPESNQLFGRVICQSGAAQAVREPDESAEFTDRWFAALGSPLNLAELRALPLADLLEIVAKVPPMRDGIGLPFVPSLDERFLPRQPLDEVRGSTTAPELLIGTTVDEMVLFTAFEADAGQAKLRRRIDRTAPGGYDKAVEVYSNEPTDGAIDKLGIDRDQRLFERTMTDRVFWVPALQLADAVASRQRATFMYRFAEPSDAFGGRLGAAHAVEIPFAFDNLDKPGVPFLLGENVAGKQSLASAMGDAWVAFASRGQPSSAGLPRWDAYDALGHSSMLLAVSGCELQVDPRSEARQYWLSQPD